MINFSIDFITGQSDGLESTIDCSMRPPSSLSPSDSSIKSSDIGSSNGDKSCSDNSTDSIAQALLTLDKTISEDENSRSIKPGHSYIALISMAILSTTDKKMLVSDIYQYISDNFSYYGDKEKAWKNSIRHNLSLNECFIKSGRADNGKGNFWSIHPACKEDFSQGDFRRRHARRRARKSATKDISIDNISSNYRYNVGYVPMTSSTIAASSSFPTYNRSAVQPNDIYTSVAVHPNDIYSSVYPASPQGLYTATPTLQPTFLPTNIPSSQPMQNFNCDVYKRWDFPQWSQQNTSVAY